MTTRRIVKKFKNNEMTFSEALEYCRDREFKALSKGYSLMARRWKDTQNLLQALNA